MTKLRSQIKFDLLTSSTLFSLRWAVPSSLVRRMQFQGDHSKDLSHLTMTRSLRSFQVLSTDWDAQMFSVRYWISCSCMSKHLWKTMFSSKHKILNYSITWENKLYWVYFLKENIIHEVFCAHGLFLIKSLLILPKP